MLAKSRAKTPGEALRRAREDHRLTTRALARLLDTSSSAISYAESGQRPLPLRWLPDLPTAIAIPVIEAKLERHLDEFDVLRKLLENAQRRRAAELRLAKPPAIVAFYKRRKKNGPRP